MICYPCKVRNCPKSHIWTNERRFAFKHLMTHPRRELELTAIELGISDRPEYDNRYTLINAILDQRIRSDC